MTNPLWTCETCSRTFANRNQSHFCGSITDLERHFSGCTPEVRKLFDAFAAAVHGCGPVVVIPEKTRIAFQVRMSFAAITPRRSYLVGHFVFEERVENPRFARIETVSQHNHVHHFRLNSVGEIDHQFRVWIREAYEVGEQKHLHPV
jgi:hypothetical protein